MFMGPPGAGKSTLAMRHGFMAASRGERVNFYLFDETIGTFCARAAGLGMDLGPHLKTRLLQAEQIDPAEILPGEFASRICNAVEKEKCRMVVIDSINGYLNTMPTERSLPRHAVARIVYLFE